MFCAQSLFQYYFYSIIANRNKRNLLHIRHIDSSNYHHVLASYIIMAGTKHSGAQRQHASPLEEAIGKIVAGTLECGKLLKKLLLVLMLIIWTIVNLPLILCAILLGSVIIFGLCIYYMWRLTLAIVIIF